MEIKCCTINCDGVAVTADIRQFIDTWLSGHVSVPATTFHWEAVGGGSINETFQVISGPHSSFVKYNRSDGLPGLLRCEKDGLTHLSRNGNIRVPVIAGNGEFEGWQWLVMEWIRSAAPTPLFWERFGQQLAALHRTTAPAFGFHQDNYIGALSQENTWRDTWANFFFFYRLQPQATLASEKGLLDSFDLRSIEALQTRLPQIFPTEPPSLLHGDLWSGNFLCDDQQQPVLIDPAVYFGHRQMDLAMTTLFGGFDPRFYDAYREAFPLAGDTRLQWEICNLYPLLIHLNLFGPSYYRRIEQTLRRFR